MCFLLHLPLFIFKNSSEVDLKVIFVQPDDDSDQESLSDSSSIMTNTDKNNNNIKENDLKDQATANSSTINDKQNQE